MSKPSGRIPPPPPTEPPPDGNRRKKKSTIASSATSARASAVLVDDEDDIHTVWQHPLPVTKHEIDAAKPKHKPLPPPVPVMNRDASGSVAPVHIPRLPTINSPITSSNVDVSVIAHTAAQAVATSTAGMEKVLTWPSGDVFEGRVDSKGNPLRGKMKWGAQSPNFGDVYEGEFNNGVMNGKGVYHWCNGNWYDGQWVFGMMSGEGTLVEKDGTTYSGMMSHNKPHGQGTKFWKSGQYVGCSYKGSFVSGQLQGEGHFSWPNGDVYTGDWHDGRRAGRGRMEYHASDCAGDVYDGEFYNGVFNGLGTYTWKSGNVYSGSWLNGVRNGEGKLTYGPESPNAGEEFEGSWENNQMDGYGVYKWPDGGSYDGQWKNGKRDGFGVRTWADGSNYSGWWENHTRQGRGVFTSHDGTTVEGSWHNGQLHGKGRKVWNSGDFKGNEYEGEWENGVPHGHGTYIWADGSRYDGEYRSGKRCGKGVMKWKSTNSTGDMYTGHWDEDKMHGPGKFIAGLTGDVVEGDWRAGKCHGKVTHWIRESGMMWEETWVNGSLVQLNEKIGDPVRRAEAFSSSQSLLPAVRTTLDAKKREDVEARLRSTQSQSSLESAVPTVGQLPPTVTALDTSALSRLMEAAHAGRTNTSKANGSGKAGTFDTEPLGAAGSLEGIPDVLGDAAVPERRLGGELSRETSLTSSNKSSLTAPQAKKEFFSADSKRASSNSMRAKFLSREASSRLLKTQASMRGLSIEDGISIRRREERFDQLPVRTPVECSKLIRNGDRGLHLIQMIVKGCDEVKEGEFRNDYERLVDLKSSITLEAKGNLILERELESLEAKIALLVRNRITVQQIIAESSGLLVEMDKRASTDSTAHLGSKKDGYTELLNLLVGDCRYLASLCRVIDPQKREALIHTTIFTVFGDQYDVRLEKQLLSIFHELIKDEFAAAEELGTVMRANTTVTKMMSAYCRRGEGADVLKRILRQPLTDICRQDELVLEMKPDKVYQQIVSRSELTSGTASTEKRELPAEEAEHDPRVIREMAVRAEELQRCSEMCLTSVMNSISVIPYGIRWISRLIKQIASKRFPSDDVRKINSLVGGFLFLRYVTPGVCTPDSMNIIDFPCTPTMRRNLVLIAKVIQNLSNDVPFGSKEPFMQRLNGFLADNTELIQAFFDKLVDVDDLDEHMYLENTYVNIPGVTSIIDINIIHISLNELFMLHRLCSEYATVICTVNDPLLDVLRKLHSAPKELPRDRDCSVYIRIQPPSVSKNRDEPLGVSVAYEHLKEMMIDVARELPLNYFYDLERSNKRPSDTESIASAKIGMYEDFNRLLHHPEPLSMFRKMLESELSGENLDFYMEVESLLRQHKAFVNRDRRLSTSTFSVNSAFSQEESIQSKILDIYRTFIDPRSQLAINVGEAHRKAIQTQLQPYLDDRKAQIDLSNFDMGPLKAAQREIFLLLCRDSFRLRFLDHPIYAKRWKTYLAFPETDFCFSRALTFAKERAERMDDWELADDLDLLGQICGEFSFQWADSLGREEPYTFNEIFDRLSLDLAMFAKVLDNVKRHVDNASKVLGNVRSRQSQLVERVEQYAAYLENIRKKSIVTHDIMRDPENVKSDLSIQRFTYAQLEQKEIIVTSSLHKDLRKKIYIIIATDDGITFEITALFKKLTVQKSNVTIEELLELSNNSERIHRVQDIDFNVNLLLHLLNTKFIAKMQKRILAARPSLRLRMVQANLVTS